MSQYDLLVQFHTVWIDFDAVDTSSYFGDVGFPRSGVFPRLRVLIDLTWTTRVS